MQPETFMVWIFGGTVGCALAITLIIDVYQHWNKCRHDWTKWSTPEKPETNGYMPAYAYQTRYCKTCNQFEKREIK
jgi:hypothetical protein